MPTLRLLRDRIDDGDGTESIALSREDSQKLAELARGGKVDPSELGLTTEELVTYEYILQQAFKAGVTAATITVVLKVAPEIIKAINYLIENGEISSEQFKKIGFAALSGSAEGFIRGTISAGITAACKAGLWGEAAKVVNPSAVYTIALMPEECTVFLSKLLHEQTYRHLSSEEQIILGTAYLEGSVSNQRLQQILDLHPTDIGKILSGLVDRHMLLTDGKGRWTSYTINEQYEPTEEQLDFSDVLSEEIEFKNDSDRKIYAYIRVNGMITTKQVIAITSIGTPQGALVALNRLIDRKLIKMAGKGHDTHYILA